MCDASCDGPQVQEGEWRRAAKAHHCYACHEAIRVGELHHVLSGVWEDGWESYRHCVRCWRMVCELGAITGEAVQLDLNCGEAFEGPEDDPMHELAFMTRAEMQEWAAVKRAKQDTDRAELRAFSRRMRAERAAEEHTDG